MLVNLVIVKRLHTQFYVNDIFMWIEKTQTYNLLEMRTSYKLNPLPLQLKLNRLTVNPLSTLAKP